MTGAVQTCGRSARCLLFPILSRRNVTTKLSRRIVEVQRFLLSCHASRCVQTSANLSKIFEVPSRAEVESLQELYPNPKTLIHELLQPLVHSGVTAAPQVMVVPRLGGRFFRAKLQLQWPSKVTVSAVHNSVAGAEHNAYLLACDLMKNMGLLHQPPSGSMTPVSQDHVLSILHTLHSSTCHPFSPSQPQFTITTSPAHPAKSSHSALFTDSTGVKMGVWPKQLWRTEVAASWPYSFDVTSLGPSCHASKYAAALHTSIKLKALGLLSNTNCLALSRLRVICRHQREAAVTSSQNFHPHYEIYSDASARGFGAYLVKKDQDHSPVHWLANSWSEHFPDCPRINPRVKVADGSLQLDSTFCELYAVVTACFTWKHKFVGQRVLVWTDSQAVVDMLNWGLHGHTKVHRWGKLLTILSDTCQKYSIELRARHVHRSANIAADLLSRCKLSAFREVVPDAAPSQKKTKKLLFWNPLQTGNGGSPGIENSLI